MANDHPLTPPKRSETVYKPPGYRSPPPASAAAQRERDRIALQGEQTEEDRAKPVGVARATQDWTPYYHGLLRQAGQQAALEGGSSADQLAINRMLGVPDTEDPDADYVPSPEALAMIEATDALIAKAQEAAAAAAENPEDREAALAAREAALDAREADIKAKEALDARETVIAARERQAAEREEALKKSPVLNTLDDMRAFKPITEEFTRQSATWGAETTSGEAWSGRQRMTAEERAVAEQEGMELFGIDPTAGSAWSKVADVAGQPRGPRHSRNPKLEDPHARIAAINDAKARAAAAQNPDDYASALADQVVYEDSPAHQDALSEQEAYDKRQRDAAAYVEEFMKKQRQGL